MNSMLVKNEETANVLVAKVMRVTFLVFSVVFLLNVVGIFVIDKDKMMFAYISGSIVLWIPTILVVLKQTATSYMKYINVIIGSIFVLLISAILTYHTPVIYIYGIAIASLYFSKKLNIFATILAVIVASLGQYLGFTLQTLPDLNFPTMYKMVVYSIVPKALTIICIASIFTILCSRTAQLLGNLMGAQEQNEMLEKMVRMQEQNRIISQKMQELVEQLSTISQSSSDNNQMIANETNEIMRTTQENAMQIQSVNENLDGITMQMDKFEMQSQMLSEAASEIHEITKVNQEIMNQAMNSMMEISNSAKESMNVILQLGEESEQIVGIIQTITKISVQTKLLALNATIEAARAGEAGKGFAVVAEEIQHLSAQTQAAVNDIEKIIIEVVQNTNQSVKSMEHSTNLTQQGLQQIKEAGESTNKITHSNLEMTNQINQMEYIAKQITENERQV